MAFGPDGALYLSNLGASGTPEVGQIVHVEVRSPEGADTD